MSKKEDTGQELVVQSEDIMALSPAAEEMREIVFENTGGEMDVTDLERVKVPSSGSTVWEIPCEEEKPEAAQEFEGIVLKFRDVRAYWPDAYGDGEPNTPPSCSSEDGKIGFGARWTDDEEGPHDCSECPFSKFGSGKDAKGEPSRGQACQQSRLLFTLRPNQLIPIIIKLPAMSIKASKKYFMNLASNGRHYWGVVTKFSLEGMKNGANQPYSEARLSKAGEFSPEQVAAMAEVRNQYLPGLEKVRSRQDEGGQDDEAGESVPI